MSTKKSVRPKSWRALSVQVGRWLESSLLNRTSGLLVMVTAEHAVHRRRRRPQCCGAKQTRRQTQESTRDQTTCKRHNLVHEHLADHEARQTFRQHGRHHPRIHSMQVTHSGEVNQCRRSARMRVPPGREPRPRRLLGSADHRIVR